MVDMDRGRLFRVAPSNSTYKIPQYDMKSVDGAIAALSNPNQSVRYLAMQALIGFGAQAEAKLAKLLDSKDDRTAARALWMLSKFDGVSETYIRQVLQSSNADLRIAAIRAARSIKLDAAKYIDPLLKDTSPQVRRELCVALREDTSKEMPRRWVELAQQFDGKDRWMLEALGIAATDRWDECLDTYMSGESAKVADIRSLQILWRSRASKTAELLADLLNSDSINIEQIDSVFRAIDFQNSTAQNTAIQKILKSVSETEDAKRDRITAEAAMRSSDPRQALADAKVAKAIQRYLTSLGMDPKVLQVADKLPIEGIADQLVDMAIRLGVNNDGIRAIDMALQKGALQRVQSMVSIDGEQEGDALKRQQAQQVTKLLALSNRRESMTILQSLIENPKVDSTIRIAAANGLARKRDGQKYLIGLAEAKTLPADAATVVAASLRSSRDEAIAKKALELFPSSASSGRPLPPIDDLVQIRGNSGSGKKLFESVATCSQCHTVRGTGKNVGPDLSEIGDKLTKEAMLVAIINPSAGISHNYEAYSALTEDDQLVTGLLVSKNDSEVILKDKDGIERKFALADVELKKLETSLMPNNLHDLFDQQGLVDIVEYMSTLKKQQ